VRNLIGLQAEFWNFSQDQADTSWEKCKYGSPTFVELMTIVWLDAFSIPALPAIDTKPDSVGLLRAKPPDCNAIG
jgi:hypothetical protein